MRPIFASNEPGFGFSGAIVSRVALGYRVWRLVSEWSFASYNGEGGRPGLRKEKFFRLGLVWRVCHVV